jgi:4-diphosphocytidyl-2-C-methyl-D-erythritol kinase
VLPGPDYLAPAKLNLFLHVVGRRTDGYHLLQSAFTLIDRSDTIRIRVRDDGAIVRVSDLAGVPAEQDLVVRAARLLKEASGTRLGADIEVEKRIPMGGGLGGGSSDAATVLMALDRAWGTGFGAEALAELGLGLGADVPFFLFGSSAWVEGIGDRIRPLDLPLRWYVVLVPPVGVPTGEVFTDPELTRDSETLKIEDFSARLAEGGFEGLAHSFSLRNDLQPVVERRFPAVARALEWLGAHGAARMTGSGSCVFASFGQREAAQSVLDRLEQDRGRMARPMQGFVAQGLAVHPLRVE